MSNDKEHAAGNTTGLFRLANEDREMIENLGANEFVSTMDLIQAQG